VRNDFQRNTKSIKYLYDSFKNERIIVDNSYQRRRVWINADNVRLIETILLNLVIPEVFLWDAEINPDTGDTITHIVDGQQRIKAIMDFIDNQYCLKKEDLIDDTIKTKYGNKYFKDLSPEIKRYIWGYDISVVQIDRNLDINDIRTMFFRLNLTDYNLNKQEKRNSIDSQFGRAAEELLTHSFWENHRLFSAQDIRRMRDVEYASNILLLSREGIVDQTTDKKLNEVYDDLKDIYKDREKDTEIVKKAMKVIDRFSNDKTFSFISKKTQMYTMFCLALDFIENKVKIVKNIVTKFTMFVHAYNLFKNDAEIIFEDEIENNIYENIKKYKLASSEGVNKMSNRMIRFETLKKVCLSNDMKLSKIQHVIDLMMETKEPEK